MGCSLSRSPTTLAFGQYSDRMPTSPGGDGAAVAVAVEEVESALEAVRDADMTVRMDPLKPVCTMAIVGDPDHDPLLVDRRHHGTHDRRDPLP